jgi:hypothetical protein
LFSRLERPMLAILVMRPFEISLKRTKMSISKHHQSSVQEKQNTTSKIIQDVGRRNGRFLEWSNCGCWNIMEDEGNIRTKIYNSLSYCKKTLNAKKNMQVNSSSTFLFERQDGKKRKRESDGTEPLGCAKACLLR